MKYKGCTIDMESKADLPPQPGRYLVSIGRNTLRVNSVYQVVTCRKVNSQQHAFRYKLELLPAPDMKEHVLFNPANGKVWVKDQEEFTIVWYSRQKNNKRHWSDNFTPPT